MPAFAALGALAGRMLPRVAGAARRVIGQAIGVARRHPTATGGVIGAIPAVGTVVMGPPRPQALPQLPSAPGPRQPRGTVRRTVERILPGGRTGRELTPYEGTEYDKIGRPIAVHAEMIERTYVPPGYVVVTMPNGDRIGVLKGVARSMGLWKGRPKPPVTAGDARAIRRANSARKRVKRLAGTVGFSCSPRGGFRRAKGRKGAR